MNISIQPGSSTQKPILNTGQQIPPNPFPFFHQKQNNPGNFGNHSKGFQQDFMVSPSPKNVDKYKLSKEIDEQLEQERLRFEKNPEQHPKYREEWTKFWTDKCIELRTAGKNPSIYNFAPEWRQYWDKRIKELNDEYKKKAFKIIGIELDPDPIPQPPCAPRIGAVLKNEANDNSKDATRKRLSSELDSISVSDSADGFHCIPDVSASSPFKHYSSQPLVPPSGLKSDKDPQVITEHKIVSNKPQGKDSRGSPHRKNSPISRDLSPQRKCRKLSPISPKRKRDTSPWSKDHRDSSPRSRYCRDSSPRSKYRRDSSPRNKYCRDSSPRNKYSRDSSPRSKYCRDSQPRSKYRRDSSPRSKYRRDSSPRSKYCRDSSPRSKYCTDSSSHSRDYRDSLPRSKDHRHSSPPGRDHRYSSPPGRDRRHLSPMCRDRRDLSPSSTDRFKSKKSPFRKTDILSVPKDTASNRTKASSQGNDRPQPKEESSIQKDQNSPCLPKEILTNHKVGSSSIEINGSKRRDSPNNSNNDPPKLVEGQDSKSQCQVTSTDQKESTLVESQVKKEDFPFEKFISINQKNSTDKKDKPKIAIRLKIHEKSIVDTNNVKKNIIEKNDVEGNTVQENTVEENTVEEATQGSEAPDKQEINLITVLGLLVALEDHLGSFGAKIMDLMTQALVKETEDVGSSNNLLNAENRIVLKSVKEKLKGQILVGLVSGALEKAFQTSIAHIEKLDYIGLQPKKLQNVAVKKVPMNTQYVTIKKEPMKELMKVQDIEMDESDDMSRAIMNTILAQETEEDLTKVIKGLLMPTRQDATTQTSALSRTVGVMGTNVYLDVRSGKVCWRCGLMDHRSITCTGEREKFCVRCGLIGKMQKDCICRADHKPVSGLK